MEKSPTIFMVSNRRTDEFLGKGTTFTSSTSVIIDDITWMRYDAKSGLIHIGFKSSTIDFYISDEQYHELLSKLTIVAKTYNDQLFKCNNTVFYTVILVSFINAIQYIDETESLSVVIASQRIKLKGSSELYKSIHTKWLNYIRHKSTSTKQNTNYKINLHKDPNPLDAPTSNNNDFSTNYEYMRFLK